VSGNLFENLNLEVPGGEIITSRVIGRKFWVKQIDETSSGLVQWSAVLAEEFNLGTLLR
jgi:hypothetical protein